MEINLEVADLIYYSYKKDIIFYKKNIIFYEFGYKNEYRIFHPKKNIFVYFDFDKNYEVNKHHKSTLYESNIVFFYESFSDEYELFSNKMEEKDSYFTTLNLETADVSKFIIKNLNNYRIFVENCFPIGDKVFFQTLLSDSKSLKYRVTEIYDLKTNTLLEKIDIDYEILAIHPNQEIVVYSNHILRMPPSPFDLYQRNTFAYSVKEKKVISEIDYPHDYSLISAKFTPNGRYFVLNTYDSYDFEKYTPILARVYDFKKNIFLYNLCEKLYLEYTIDYDLKHMFFSNNSKYGIFYLEPAIVLVFEIELGKIIVVKEEVFEMIYDSESDMILYTMDDYKKNEKTFIIESLEEFIEKNRTIKKSFLIDSDE